MRDRLRWLGTRRVGAFLLVRVVSGAATALDRLRRVTFLGEEPERRVPGFLS